MRTRVNRLAEEIFGLHHNLDKLDTQQVSGKKLRLRAELKTALESEDSEAEGSIEVEQEQG